MNTNVLTARDEQCIAVNEQTLVKFAQTHNLPAQSGRDLYACALRNQESQIGSTEVTVGALGSPLLVDMLMPQLFPDLEATVLKQRKVQAEALREAFLESRNHPSHWPSKK